MITIEANAHSSDVALWQRLLGKSCRLLIGYGSTEAPTAFQWLVPSDWTADAARVPVGYAQAGIEFALVNEAGTPAMAGELGELVLKSPYLALGNWQNGQLTAGDIQTSPDDAVARILNTGDLFKLREDGLAEFASRKDRAIKIRGIRADLAEVEDALRNCDYVVDTAVVWRGDEQNQALIAYVVSDMSDERLLVERLSATVAARLPTHMRPSQFRVVDAIPRLPTLKADVQALAKLDTASCAPDGNDNSARRESAKDEGASSRINCAVEKAWIQLLDRNSFAENLRWDQSGGNSLKALTLWFYIEEALGKHFPLDEFDSNTTPLELIAAIDRQFGEAFTSATPDGDSRPLVFLMPPASGDGGGLVRFRAAFHGKFRFALGHYLSWREMCRPGINSIRSSMTSSHRLLRHSARTHVSWPAIRSANSSRGKRRVASWYPGGAWHLSALSTRDGKI